MNFKPPSLLYLTKTQKDEKFVYKEGQFQEHYVQPRELHNLVGKHHEHLRQFKATEGI